MITPFDKTLQRLKARRSENPEYDMAARQLSSMSTDLNYATQNINAKMGRMGESISAQVGAMLAKNESISSIYNKVFSEAENVQARRIGAIDNQILNVEGERDQYIFQKQQEEKARKEGTLKSIMQIGGTALGAVVGSVIPGIGTMAGMQLGASLGGTAANVGIPGTGHADPDAILQNVAAVIPQVSSMVSTNYSRQVMNTLAPVLMGTQTLSDGKKFTELPIQQQEMINSMIANGQYEAAFQLMGLQLPDNRWSGQF